MCGKHQRTVGAGVVDRRHVTPPKGWRTAAAMSALTFIVAAGGPATSSPATRTHISVSPPRDGPDPSLGSRGSNVRADEQCTFEHTYLGNLPKEKEPGWHLEGARSDARRDALVLLAEHVPRRRPFRRTDS
jgi:hypothetical protein